MQTPSEQIESAAGGILSSSWEHATQGPFRMFNDGGTECEVGEFLFGLVRMLKPQSILETGTHKGISSTYMAMALRCNWSRHDVELPRPYLITLEIAHEHKNSAQELWDHLGLEEFVQCFIGRSLEFGTDVVYDFALFDSEPQLRFAEVERFWNNLAPGAVFIIHDLHPHLGHTGVVNTDHPDEPDWPYGDIRQTFLGRKIMDHEVAVMSFPTPRGITMFQKTKPGFLATELARGYHCVAATQPPKE